MTSMTSVPQDSEEIFESNWVLHVLNSQVGFHHQCVCINILCISITMLEHLKSFQFCEKLLFFLIKFNY